MEAVAGRCSSKQGALKNFANFTGKHLCQSFFLIKLQTQKPATLLKTDSSTGVFLMKFANFLRTSFFTERIWWLLLKAINSSSYLRVLPTAAKTFFTNSSTRTN